MKSFSNYQKCRIFTDENEIANGDFVLRGITIRVSHGMLNDVVDDEKGLLPAVETHDGNHIEHWKNGLLHCETGPAIIDVIDNREEWWFEGNLVEPISRGEK